MPSATISSLSLLNRHFSNNLTFSFSPFSPNPSLLQYPPFISSPSSPCAPFLLMSKPALLAIPKFLPKKGTEGLMGRTVHRQASSTPSPSHTLLFGLISSYSLAYISVWPHIIQFSPIHFCLASYYPILCHTFLFGLVSSYSLPYISVWPHIILFSAIHFCSASYHPILCHTFLFGLILSYSLTYTLLLKCIFLHEVN